jgi:hydroxymethylpyrimidine/phosphomethylpyrimidine kinase
VTQQLDAVFSGVEIAAVKIGMLGTFEIVEVVIDAIRRHTPSFVVLDPVIRATSGTSLLDEPGVDLMRSELLPLVDLLTPNAMEAGTLLRCTPPITTADARSAAEQLVGIGARNALVTGGHLRQDATVVDVLVGRHGIHELRSPRVSGPYTRGTGCRLSSAIAAFVALGIALPDACGEAQRFVGRTIVDGL